MEATKKITELKTRIVKSWNGWEGRTTRTEKGQTFEITTLKRYNGKIITVATKVEQSISGGFLTTAHGMNDDFFAMDHGKIRATEKAISEAHFKGLAAFDLKIEETPEAEIKPEIAEIGDILFLDGYGETKSTKGNNWIIYDIQEGHSSKQFLCIEKDTLELRRKDHVRPYSKKFGIGIYFEKGFNMGSFGIDENRLSDMLIEAQDVAKIKAEEAAKEQEEANRIAAERKAYLSQFVKADRRKTTNILKKYCKENFNISKIEVSTDVFSGGDSMHVTYYAPQEIEELENFIESFEAGSYNSMEEIYEYDSKKEDIIISGHILETYKFVSVKHKEGEGKTQNQPPKKETTSKEPKESIQSNSVNAEISHNTEKNGIEIKFPSKPSEEVLNSLKRLGFRWSRFNGIWWAKYSEELLQQVQENLN